MGTGDWGIPRRRIDGFGLCVHRALRFVKNPKPDSSVDYYRPHLRNPLPAWDKRADQLRRRRAGDPVSGCSDRQPVRKHRTRRDRPTGPALLSLPDDGVRAAERHLGGHETMGQRAEHRLLPPQRRFRGAVNRREPGNSKHMALPPFGPASGPDDPGPIQPVRCYQRPGEEPGGAAVA